MHDDAVELCRVTEAIPIGLLHLPRFVGVEDEVAARRAPRQCPDHAGLDDASSGHAGDTSEKRACGAARNYRPLARNAPALRHEPPAAASPRHHNEITEDPLRAAQRGWDLYPRSWRTTNFVGKSNDNGNIGHAIYQTIINGEWPEYGLDYETSFS